MELYQHQQQIINESKTHALLALGTGGGKTITALMLAQGSTLVICPKQQREDQTWQRNLKKINKDITLTVISKEDFKKIKPDLKKYNTVIIDECHTVLGVLPDTVTKRGVQWPKTSQLFMDLYQYLKEFPPERLYLLSATPASKPMNVFALGLLFKKWEIESFFRFREKYYIQRRAGYRSIWLPRNTKELKQRLADVVKGMGYTGKLEDWFDVPDQTHKTVHFGLTTEQNHAIKELKQNESDPMVIRARMRTIENGCLYTTEIEQIDRKEDKIKRGAKYFKSEKIDYILERAEEFPKMLVFATYIAQIEAISLALIAKGYKVLTLTGATKDRATLIQRAEEAENVIVIAQSGISSGYELKSVPVVIFASKSYKFLDYVQGVGRILRADALKKNLYLHLVVKGGMDESCHKAIEAGQDFQEKIMNNI